MAKSNLMMVPEKPNLSVIRTANLVLSVLGHNQFTEKDWNKKVLINGNETKSYYGARCKVKGCGNLFLLSPAFFEYRLIRHHRGETHDIFYEIHNIFYGNEFDSVKVKHNILNNASFDKIRKTECCIRLSMVL